MSADQNLTKCSYCQKVVQEYLKVHEIFRKQAEEQMAWSAILESKKIKNENITPARIKKAVTKRMKKYSIEFKYTIKSKLKNKKQPSNQRNRSKKSLINNNNLLQISRKILEQKNLKPKGEQKKGNRKNDLICTLNNFKKQLYKKKNFNAQFAINNIAISLIQKDIQSISIQKVKRKILGNQMKKKQWKNRANEFGVG